jgi:hypothetical protein
VSFKEPTDTKNRFLFKVSSAPADGSLRNGDPWRERAVSITGSLYWRNEGRPGEW